MGEELEDAQGPVQFKEDAEEDPVEIQKVTLATMSYALVSPCIYDSTK